MAYKIFENILAVVNNPHMIRDRFVDALSYYQADYAVSKTVAFYIDPYNGVAVGNTTLNIINQVSYPESEHFLICGIRGLSGAAASLAQSAWVAGISDALTINGSFNLINSGTTEIKNMPMTAFQPGTNYPDSGLLLLEKPVFWKAQTQLSIQIAWPTAPTTANQNIRFELMGIKLI